MSERGYPDNALPGWLLYQPKQEPPADHLPLPGAPWFASFGLVRVVRGRIVHGCLTRDHIYFGTGEHYRWPPLFLDEGGSL